MAQQLVLLTSKYPCAKGEEFIESEIGYIAEKFSKVFVVPTYLQGDSTQTRPLPENCKLVMPVLAQDGRVRSLIRRTFTALRSSMVEIHPARPYKFPIDMRFAVKSLGSADRVMAALADAGADPMARTLLYAYWLYRPAAVAATLRADYFSGSARAVSRAHGFDVYPERSLLGHLPARKFLVESLDRIFPVSDSAAEVISQIRGASHEQIEIARLGVVGPTEMAERTISRPVHFVSCSSLAPLKQVNRIAHAFGELIRYGETRFQWTHIGDSGRESLESLRSTIREEGLTAYANTPGRMDNPAVLDFFSRPDVHFLVNFSSTEGVPVTVMEAAAHGVPAIATNVGGTGEFVQHGHNGYLLASNADTDELAAAIRRVIDMNESQYKDMSNGARGAWAEMADASVQYPRFAERLEEISDESMPGGRATS